MRGSCAIAPIPTSACAPATPRPQFRAAQGDFSLNSILTFNVNAGDTYGFRFGGFAYSPGLSGTFTVQVPQQPQDPTTKDDCKDGGWEAYGFSNQGQCIAFVETGHDSR